MNVSGKDNRNTDGTKRAGRQRTASHRDPGAGSPHVFTREGPMIRAADGSGYGCAACTFPKAATPQIQVRAPSRCVTRNEPAPGPNVRRHALRPPRAFVRPQRLDLRHGEQPERPAQLRSGPRRKPSNGASDR